MTEPRRQQPARPRRRKPSALPVIAGSLAAFFALFGFMAYELRIGHDPALGDQRVAMIAKPTKRVVVKRLEHHVIVTKLLPPREQEGSDDGGGQVAVVPAQSAPVVVQAPAPQPAPAVVGAPAPAPQPAPVVTATS